MVTHACNPNIWEAEVEGLQVPGQTGLYREFQASLSYTARPCLSQNKPKPNNNKRPRKRKKKKKEPETECNRETKR
jgi:hypothetical protein